MRTLAVVVMLTAVMYISNVVAAPVVFYVTPSADTFVRSDAPDSNYGGAGGLSVSGPLAVNGNGDPMGIFATLMMFNTQDFVVQADAYLGLNNWFVSDITLTLSEQGAPNNNIFNRGVGLLEIYWIGNDSWIEGSGNPRLPTQDGVVYNDLPSLLDGNVDTSLGSFLNAGEDGPIQYALLLNPAFSEDLMSGTDVSLYVEAADPYIGFTFDGRNQAAPPTLTFHVQAIPEPATIVLMAGGLVMLIGRHRPQKKR